MNVTPAIFKDITVVIPVYNRAGDIVACLDSVAAQSVRPARVIVVDDGSADGSADAARAHPLCPDVIAAPHVGAAAARNIGLDAVTTCWTMFFDSDDTMQPDHIAMAMTAVSDDVDIVGWDVRARNADGWSKCLPFEIRNIQWHNIMHGTMSTQRYMARTELFRRVGGWNADAAIWNDIELGTRLLSATDRIVKVDTPTLCIINAHSQSITGSSWLSRKDRYLATLDIISRTLGPKYAPMIALKRAILAADIAREDAAAGRDLYHSITPRTLAVRIAYRYRRMGGRGVARLLSPLINKNPRP